MNDFKIINEIKAEKLPDDIKAILMAEVDFLNLKLEIYEIPYKPLINILRRNREK